jgi:hypothetical protein
VAPFVRGIHYTWFMDKEAQASEVNLLNQGHQERRSQKCLAPAPALNHEAAVSRWCARAGMRQAGLAAAASPPLCQAQAVRKMTFYREPARRWGPESFWEGVGSLGQQATT